MEPFGYTNNPDEYHKITKFVNAAMKDGWTRHSKYKSDRPSGMINLEKDGFTMFVIIRRDVGRWKYQAEATIWGPDELVVPTPEVYNMEEIKNGLFKCGWCKKEGVPTKRVAFANRVCNDCYPEAKRKLETKGWAD